MIIGVNSIAAYCITDGGVFTYVSKALYTHLGQKFDIIFGLPYASLVSGGLVLFIVWLILYWMYKRKIFIKI
jgi:predicted acyltransferase